MKYIAYYDIPEFEKENRNVALCAVNVMSYMVEVMNDFTDLEIISPSRTRNTKGIYRGRKVQINNKTTLQQPFTFGTKTKLGRAIAALYTRLWLLLVLLKNVKKGETIVAYHSLALMRCLVIVKSIKKCRLVLELREIYSDARQAYDEFQGQSMSRLHTKEMKFFDYADKYIFPTELLNQIVNKSKKPYVVAPGIYKKEETISFKQWQDDKIHIVYAGTLRESKGVLFAIDVAAKLPPSYHVHILGGGSTETIQNLQKRIHDIQDVNHAGVSFEGKLTGDEFKAFLQSCHIGLVPQNPEAAFTDTSFPSKILTYLANGLDVVSIKIPSVFTSPVGKFLHYYEKNDIQNFAQAIQSVKIDGKQNNKNNLDILDEQLRNQMKILLD